MERRIWTKNIGTVVLVGSDLMVSGDAGQLYDWSHRPGQAWPCSTLAVCDRVSAELDGENGDLLGLSVNGEIDDETSDLSGDELTAWLDDCLQGTPFAHLARNPV